MVSMVPFRMMVYAENKAEYIPIDEATDEDKVLNISGTDLRHRLQDGLEIPEWFSFPDVVAELRQQYMKLKGEKQELIGKVEQFERA